MSYLEQLTSEGGAVADGRAAPEHPARAVWDLLERQGLTGGVELLSELPDGRIGLQLKPRVSDEMASAIMWTVDWAVGVLKHQRSEIDRKGHQYSPSRAKGTHRKCSDQ